MLVDPAFPGREKCLAKLDDQAPDDASDDLDHRSRDWSYSPLMTWLCSLCVTLTVSAR